MFIGSSTYTIEFSPIFIILDNERDHGPWEAHNFWATSTYTNLKSRFRCSQLCTTHIYLVNLLSFRWYVLLNMCWGQNPKAYQSLNMMSRYSGFYLFYYLNRKCNFVLAVHIGVKFLTKRLFKMGKTGWLRRWCWHSKNMLKEVLISRSGYNFWVF